MRITLDVKWTDPGWTLQALGEDGQPLQAPGTGEPLQRTLRQPGDPPDDPLWSFPMPPEIEAQVLPDDAPHKKLCLAEKESVLRKDYQRIVDRDTSDGVVERFGRYLFATLLGTDLWGHLRTAAGVGAIELALQWDLADPVLNRYPWEMMHDGDDFLAFQPEVTITRRVAFRGSHSSQVKHPARLLFVMGTGLNDDRIRPGAEYMCMVRTLGYAGLLGDLRTKVLVQATTERLAEAMERFRPTIVHFTCHGWFDQQGRPFLELHDADTKEAKRIYPKSLLELLQVGDASPPVVILSACLSATVEEQSEKGDPGAPYAASLVHGNRGVPIVVGMAGRVADQACRLFTQRFYRALLTGQDIAKAVAGGRRAAFQHGGYDPHTEADWAFPTLFLGHNVSPTLSFQQQEWLQTARTAAGEYAHPDFPPFCDRLQVLESYDLLLADSADQKAVFQKQQGIQVLAFRTDEGCGKNAPGPRFGRTWQLKDLGGWAAHDGHLPVFVQVPKDARPVSTLLELLDRLEQALELTAIHFDLPIDYADRHWKRVRDLHQHHPNGTPDPAQLPDDLKQKWDQLPDEVRERWDKRPAPILARALRCDLEKFLDLYRAQVDDADRNRIKLLLLLDDLDRMLDEAVSDFLHEILGPFGLRRVRDDVRVAFVYVKEDQAEATARPSIKSIVKWLGENVWAETIPLRPFEDGLEQRLAYQRLLFNWRDEEKEKRIRYTTVAETSQNSFQIDMLFETLSEVTRGVPSNLTRQATNGVVLSFRKMQVLREANDDDAFTTGPGRSGP